MTIYFSKSQIGFYDTAIFGERIREDGSPNPDCMLPDASELVEITAEQHEALLAGQTEGRIITAGEDGAPLLTDPAGPTTEQLASRLRAKRDALLDAVVALLQRHELQKTYGQATTLTDDQAAQLATYAQALRDVPQQQGFPQTVVWPDAPALTATTDTED